ncbi:phage tail tube protein [[Eubacterium] hominis]|uniref:phage tail tube protein n=1 Tax=[Eubacterium] hominis TaxID=2764325 RepID=UPI003A4D5C74
MSTTIGIATREELLSYLNTGTEAEPVWSLIGAGFSDLTEALNATTKDSHYIHQKTGTSSVIGYAPTFTFAAELDKGDPAATFIANIGRERKIGADCETDIVNVYSWMKGTTEDSVVAYKQHVAIKVDNSGSGVGGDVLSLAGAFMYKGDAVKGEWDTKTNTFKEI